MSPDLDTSLNWWTAGESVVADRLDGLTDADLAAPSALPDWSRAHVIAHLARNADALVNLLTWARTGVETPMYPSQEARDAGIAETAALPPGELRADYTATRARLADAVDTMSGEAWAAEVRTRQGAALPATQVPWMRAKELWVHGADLSAGLSLADAPDGFCEALVDDVLGVFGARGQFPDATIKATDVDRAWGSGVGPVHGPVAAIATWLTRGDASELTGEVPPAPHWL